jgi:hypothetical protein
MLVGIAGLVIPVVIHLIGRRRAPVVRFAAVDFLLGSNRRIARRLRLREILLLAARVLICVAIPLALAKPYASCASAGPIADRGPQAAVLIIDNALVGAYRLGDGTVLERAREQARAILDQMGPEAQVAVLTTAEGASPPEGFSRDHLALRDALAALEVSPRPGDITLALRRAAQLLATSTQRPRRIYLVSPLPAAAMRVGAEREPLWPAELGIELVVVNPAAGAILDNVAVVDVAVEPDPDVGPRGLRVTAELVNFGVAPVEDRAIDLWVEDIVVARGRFSLRAGEQTHKRFSVAMPDDSRIADVVVDIGDDALTLDDRRFLRAELRAEVRALLVNGDPRTVRHEDELFYLEAALRPGDRADSGILVTTGTADTLGDVDLAAIDVVVLANVATLAPGVVDRLARWARRGGGLLIALGDRVDADRYNQELAPLLPQTLRSPLDVAHGSEPREQRGRALRLTKLEPSHPIFRVFATAGDDLGDAAFHRIMLLGPTTRVDDRRVLARYSNGAPALIAARLRPSTPIGDEPGGRVVLFSSTLDRDWNDLAIHPAYVPLVQQTVRYLAHKHDQPRVRTVSVGHRHSLSLGAAVQRVEITGPGGDRTVLEGERVADGHAVGFTGTDRPGFYRVSVARAGREIQPRRETDFAVNIDPRASDLRRAHADLVAPSADGRLLAAALAPRPRRRVELWHAIAAGLLLILLFESVILLR